MPFARGLGHPTRLLEQKLCLAIWVMELAIGKESTLRAGDSGGSPLI
jgi:hypothetical protein